jgi:hypothetical protein
MPPQLLSAVKPAARASFNVDPFQERPKAAQAFGQCISAWSRVEAQIGQLFLFLLQANPKLGAEAYIGLESGKAKRDAIKTLALSALSADDYKIVLALLRLVKAKQKLRDLMAHWVWGVSPDIEDAMLLIDTKTIMSKYAKLHEFHGNIWLLAVLHPSLSPDDIYVYTEKSLRADASDFLDVSRLVQGLNLYLSQINTPLSSRLRDEIIADAHLATFLSP